ncbi:MAG: LuxR C-terminal-related transcriptional regulator, partial [Mycobacteriales bacterium]
WLGASEDAARYLAAAVPLAREQGDAAVLAGLLTELGRVRQRLGRPSDADVLWQEAAETYARLGDTVHVAGIERELGLLAWSQGELEDARTRFAAAERALDGLAPSPEHAELLYATMVTASRVGDVDAVVTSTSRLHQLAAALGSASLSARTHLADAVIAYAETDYVGMAEHSAQGLAAAEASNEPALMMRAHDQLSVAAASQGDLPALRRHSEASLHLTTRLGAPSLSGWPRIRLAYADLLAGDWDAALRTTAEIVTLARRYVEQRGMVSSIAAHALVLVHLGRLDEAQGYVRQAREAARPMLETDRNIFSMVAMAGAQLALAQDDPAEALVFSAQLSDLTGGWFPLLAAATLGEAQVRAGDLDAARALSARLRTVRTCATCLPQALGDWLDGLAEAAAGRDASAAPLLAGATTGLESLGLPFHAARARFARAQALLGPEPAAAAEEATAAFRTFDLLGAPIDAQRARTLLRGLGKVPSRGRARGRSDVQLSPRELEVARLVATGLSNAAVATQLYVSPRTVTTHLDRIYARLGLTSRVALTRYLADSGLLDEADT